MRPASSRIGLAALAFLLPALVLFSIYVVYPIAQSVRMSFYEWDGLSTPTFVGLRNYTEMVGDEVFRTAAINSAWWLVLFLLSPPLGLALALFLNQQMAGMRLYKSLFFVPFVLSGAVVGMVYTWFYDPNTGLLAALLGRSVPILGDERWATFGIIFAALWPQTAFCLILYLTGLTGVNRELVEAARLEGARGWTMLRHVILPQLRPATFMAVVVTVIGALRSFDLVSVMTGGGPYDSSTVLAFYMVEQSISYFRHGYGAAVAVVLMAVMGVYIGYFLSRMLRQESTGR